MVGGMILTPSLASFKTRASWDTKKRLNYNPQRTYPKIPITINPNTNSQNKPQSLNITTQSLTKPVVLLNPSLLLSRKDQKLDKGTVFMGVFFSAVNQFNGTKSRILGKSEETTYLGFETWLASPPKVESPRSIYNAAQLAYIGDSIYELYARRHFLFPPLNIEEYNDRVMAVVRCEAQDAMLQKLIDEKYLSEDERDVLRWGKNIGSSKTRTKKRVGAALYNRASSLETLVGYLYLTDKNRLEEVMLKLGFSCN